MRYFGNVGYGIQTETAPGVWTPLPVEYPYYGDVVRNTLRSRESGEKVNLDQTLGHSISIVADEYARQHFSAIQYVSWEGVRWRVVDVTLEPPRLLLRLGGVYDGPKPA